MRAEQPTRPGETAPLDPRRLDAELRDFGFKDPVKMPARSLPGWGWGGGPEALRRWAVGWVIIAIMSLVTLLYILACGTTDVQSCGWAVPFAAIFLVLQLVFLAALGWYIMALPAHVEDPHHRAVAGQFAASEMMYPSRDVVFDPDYGKAPPRG